MIAINPRLTGGRFGWTAYFELLPVTQTLSEIEHGDMLAPCSHEHRLARIWQL